MCYSSCPYPAARLTAPEDITPGATAVPDKEIDSDMKIAGNDYKQYVISLTRFNKDLKILKITIKFPIMPKTITMMQAIIEVVLM